MRVQLDDHGVNRPEESNGPKPLTFWSCPNGHAFTDSHMPQSGTRCNVVGCEGTRQQYRVVDEESVWVALNELCAATFDSQDMNTFYAMAVGEVELTRHFVHLWKHHRTRIVAVDDA